MTYLASQGATKNHPLFSKRDVKRRLFIVVASDKGLAGAYNSNVFKAYIRELQADNEAGVESSVVAIGRRTAQFVSRLKNADVLGVYENLPDQPNGAELHAILETARDKFVSGDVDAVDVVYTRFISSINQQVEVKRVLPAGFTETEVTESVRTALYEPSTDAVLDSVAYRLVGAQIFQGLLDARASEHSMRMVAMKNASDNASELVDDLTLEMNKARQSAITQELAEISGGVEALSE